MQDFYHQQYQAPRMRASQDHWEKMGVGDWIGVQQVVGFRDPPKGCLGFGVQGFWLRVFERPSACCR